MAMHATISTDILNGQHKNQRDCNEVQKTEICLKISIKYINVDGEYNLRMGIIVPDIP